MVTTDFNRPGKIVLKEFGFVMAGAIAGLFGILLPWLLGRSWPVWPWPLSGFFFIAAIAFPAVLRYVYVAWMRLGLLLNKITTPLILGILFYLVITPAGLIKRVFGRDAMRRECDDETESYRIASQQPDDEHMERPF